MQINAIEDLNTNFVHVPKTQALGIKLLTYLATQLHLQTGGHTNDLITETVEDFFERNTRDGHNETIASAKTHDRWTPLHYAAALNADKLARFLIREGVNKAPQNDRGETPLRIAIEMGHENVVEALLCLPNPNLPLDQLPQDSITLRNDKSTGDNIIHILASHGNDHPRSNAILERLCLAFNNPAEKKLYIDRENHDGVRPKMIAYWRGDERKQDILACHVGRYDNFIDFVEKVDHPNASENRPSKLISSSDFRQISRERKASLVNELVEGLLKNDTRLKKSLDDYAIRWIKPLSLQLQPQPDENGYMCSSANYQKLITNVLKINHLKFLQAFFTELRE